MPVNFPGVPTWRDVITGPSDGDEASGLEVSDMGVLLADRTQFLRAADNEGWHKQILSAPAFNETVDSWEYDANAFGWVCQATANNRIRWSAHLPPKGSITGIRVLRNGNGSGGSGHTLLPTLPEYRIRYVDRVANIQGYVINISDSAGGVAAYEADPVVPQESAIAPFPIEENMQFWVEVQGESGANAIQGLLFLYGIEILVEPAEVT